MGINKFTIYRDNREEMIKKLKQPSPSLMFIMDEREGCLV